MHADAGRNGESLRVLVNLLWMVPGVVGGSEESITEALRAVADSEAQGLDIRLAVLSSFDRFHPDLSKAFATEVSAIDGASKPRRVLEEHLWLTRTARRTGADVVHHAGGTVPFVHPGQCVLTIHDLQPLDMPENFSLPKRTYLSAMLARSARSAAVIQVPSEFTGQRVVHLLGVDPDAIRVVPWSVRHLAPRPTVAGVAGSLGSSIREAVGGRPFMLYPAITYPHKNHRVLLEAFATVPDEAVLVLTGGEGPCEAQVRSRIARSDLAGRVIRLGRVPTRDLETLFAEATALVFPSRYEGFGLPVLEAMLAGVPVVAADAGSLPEVAGAGELVDPDDVTGWSNAVQAVLNLSTVERRDRVEAGRREAERFSAERTAAGLIDVYRRAEGGAPGTQ